MKKLLIDLLLVFLLKSFISATPSCGIKQIKVVDVSKTYVSASSEITLPKETVTEIHPLDIFAFTFE